MPPSGSEAKRCSTCKEWKPLEEFNRRSTARDGRQWSCRDCNKAYHYEHFDRHIAQIRARNKREIRMKQRRLLAYFLEHPCVDCGETDTAVLEFDHLSDKTADISRMIRGHSWERILVEISKCEVVCANCHRRRTYQRQRSWRVVGVADEPS
jgi:Zn-finger protein